MKNINNWKPSKFVYNRRGKLIASKNLEGPGAGSRLMVNIMTEFYESALRKYAKVKLIDLRCEKVPISLSQSTVFRLIKTTIDNRVTKRKCIVYPNGFFLIEKNLRND